MTFDNSESLKALATSEAPDMTVHLEHEQTPYQDASNLTYTVNPFGFFLYSGADMVGKVPRSNWMDIIALMARELDKRG